MLTGIFMKYIVKERLNNRTTEFGFFSSDCFSPNPSFEKLTELQKS